MTNTISSSSFSPQLSRVTLVMLEVVVELTDVLEKRTTHGHGWSSRRMVGMDGVWDGGVGNIFPGKSQYPPGN